MSGGIPLSGQVRSLHGSGFFYDGCPEEEPQARLAEKRLSNLEEERVGQFAGALGVTDTAVPVSAADQRAKDLLLNGPAINGPATTQDDIDAMFA